MAPAPADREHVAYQAFLGAARRFWSEAMLPVLSAEAATVRAGKPGLDEARLAELLSARGTYGFFCWLERHLQRMKYSAPRGLVAAAERDAGAIRAYLGRPLRPGALHLAPEVVPPGWYAEWDIHQQPGGLAGSDLAGAIYRAAAGGSGGVVARNGLHERFAACVARHMPGGWDRLVDLGCGFGKSTLPLAQARPAAEVVGVDLSAPCLRLAAQIAEDLGLASTRFVQADVLRSGLPAAGADVVTSTMLLHEMPPEAIAAMLREARRLLRPGGLSIHLDFLPRDDAFLRLLHFGHGRRNNEPFMEPLARMDLAAAHEAAGLEAMRIEEFEDEDGALARPDGRKWRLPWAVIIARKPG